MVEIHNLLKFCNILVIFCFWISVIDNYRILSNKYKPLYFIVNTFNLLISAILIFIRLYPEKITIDMSVNIINLINFILQIICGIFMLGLSKISIAMGFFCIVNSLFNLFTFIFLDNKSNELDKIKNTEVA